MDHYEIVYPILKKYNVSGLFFLSSNIFEKKILDINLIHRIIANSNFDDLYEEFRKLLLKNNIKDEYKDKIIFLNSENDIIFLPLLLIFCITLSNSPLSK